MVWPIHRENLHRYTPNFRKTKDPTLFGSKVILPPIEARVEQAHKLSSFHPGNIGSFVSVAVWTGERQVVFESRSSMLLRYNVVDLEREK